MIYMGEIAREAVNAGLVAWIGRDRLGGLCSHMTLLRLRPGVQRRDRPELHSVRFRDEEMARLELSGWMGRLTRDQIDEAREFIRVQGCQARRAARRYRPGTAERRAAAAERLWRNELKRRAARRRAQQRWERDPRTLRVRREAARKLQAVREAAERDRADLIERLERVDQIRGDARQACERAERERDEARREIERLQRELGAARAEIEARRFAKIPHGQTETIDGVIATGSVVDYLSGDGVVRRGVVQQRLVHQGWIPGNGFYRIADAAVLPDRIMRVVRGCVGVNRALPLDGEQRARRQYARVEDGQRLGR